MRGENKHFLHTSVYRNKFFLLELRTNCIVLYSTTLKIFFLESPVQSCTTQDENQSVIIVAVIVAISVANDTTAFG